MKVCFEMSQLMPLTFAAEFRDEAYPPACPANLPHYVVHHGSVQHVVQRRRVAEILLVPCLPVVFGCLVKHVKLIDSQDLYYLNNDFFFNHITTLENIKCFVTCILKKLGKEHPYRVL